MTKLAALCLAAVVTATSMGMVTTPSVAHGKGGVSFGLSFGSPHYYSYRPYRHRYYPAYPRRHYRPSYDAHVAWCYDRYRSYRAWDNTFQPYNGPRRQCRSPYA